ncbi:MAG: DNA topoisomerase I, partial [Alphaproteobacteria bacterium]|nr:DNA topoisomerase I [Alphaproteobacteria bacterium]
SLPRELGNHPDTGKPILAGLGRFGPYLLTDGKYTTLRNDDVLTIGINRAVAVLAEAKAPAKAAEPIRTIGKHPENNADLQIFEGKYGPYIKFGKVNASLPRDADVNTFSLEEAIALIEKKSATPGGKKKSAPKKKAAPKAEKAVPKAEKPAAKAAKPKAKKA